MSELVSDGVELTSPLNRLPKQIADEGTPNPLIRYPVQELGEQGVYLKLNVLTGPLVCVSSFAAMATARYAFAPAYMAPIAATAPDPIA